MKFWESVHFFDHSWQTVSTAHWQKYPNIHNPSVTSVDYLDREVTADGKLLSTRYLLTRFSLPKWFEKTIGTSSVGVCETSVVDPQAQTLTMRSQNASFGSVFIMEECIVYQPDPENPTRTKMTQDCYVSVNLYGNSLLEDQILKTVAKNAHKGRDALESVISRIEDELTQFGQELRDKTTDLLPKPVQCEGSAVANIALPKLVGTSSLVEAKSSWTAWLKPWSWKRT
eukprot:m.60615 g.60615  ORF g.60615 m.60615 type:complete len:228 (-) comp49375_c0_seq1:87-770(-)